jgi:hypothetical protein
MLMSIRCINITIIGIAMGGLILDMVTRTGWTVTSTGGGIGITAR